MGKQEVYKTARHPSTGKWYVVGYTGMHNGRAQYMQLSGPYASEQEAHRRIAHQKQADRAARLELSGWNGD